MLVAPMHPQAPQHLHLPSSSAPADTAASPTIMTPVIPPQPSSHSSTASRPNMPCGLTSNATTGPPSAIARPKLTLQTSSLPRTFGSSSTGLSLSLATGPTASPTVRNTFKNAYDVTHPTSAAVSPSRATNCRFSKPSSPYTSHNPYQLPLGVKSILRNSPIESTRRRSNSVAPSASNCGSSSRRVFFPTKKQVSYRLPLEEEIKTVKYTARHSDIVSEPEPEIALQTSSDDDSDCSTSSLISSGTTTSDDSPESERSVSSGLTSEKKKKKRKYRSAERQVRAVALMDGLERDNYTSSLTPQTPRQNRVKRRCEWRWTLGPLEEARDNNTATGSPQLNAVETLDTTSLVTTSQSKRIEKPIEKLDSPASSGESTVVPPLGASSEPSNHDLQSSDTAKYESKKNTSPCSELRNPDPPE